MVNLPPLAPPLFTIAPLTFMALPSPLLFRALSIPLPSMPVNSLAFLDALFASFSLTLSSSFDDLVEYSRIPEILSCRRLSRAEAQLSRDTLTLRRDYFFSFQLQGKTDFTTAF